MSTYAIGDIQGCYQELLQLLDAINFDQAKDQLWFTGDLVNRGPESLEVLRFVKQLNENTIITLGNHDLHLIAVAENPENKKSRDTLDEILAAPDKVELLKWLRQLSLIHTDQDTGFTLIHAGLVPQWDLHKTMEVAQEAEAILKSDNFNDFLAVIYGSQPDQWSDDLAGYDRIRFIINCFTRLRYCNKSGKIDFEFKGAPGSEPKGILPWFCIKNRKTKKEKILFGHWSTVRLGNIEDFRKYNVYPMDNGCVWGGTLTAIRLDDEQWFSVPSRQPKKFEL
jgi:bis(5'-nucleosyl)-tetraphosphatase (symmetrical)